MPHEQELSLGSPCPNCATVLQGPWCYVCGQKATDYHRSFLLLAREALAGLIDVDGRMWTTWRRLATQPGRLTREYLDGKRAGQLPPFRLFLIAVVILLLAGPIRNLGPDKTRIRFAPPQSTGSRGAGGVLLLVHAVLAELAAASQDAKAVAASMGRAIRTYSMMTILFGETDAAAQAEAARYRQGLDEGALHGMMRAYGFLDAEIGRENAFVQKARSTFMTPHVLGTPAKVIGRLTEIFEQTSLDGLMLIFPDYLAGMPIFGKQVLPVLRQRFPSRVPALSDV